MIRCGAVNGAYSGKGKVLSNHEKIRFTPGEENATGNLVSSPYFSMAPQGSCSWFNPPPSELFIGFGMPLFGNQGLSFYRLYVEAVSWLNRLVITHVLQDFADLFCSPEGDGERPVKLGVVPVHFRQGEDFGCQE